MKATPTMRAYSTPHTHRKSRSIGRLIIYALGAAAVCFIIHGSFHQPPVEAVARGGIETLCQQSVEKPPRSTSCKTSTPLPSQLIAALEDVGGCRRLHNVCWDNSKLVVNAKDVNRVQNITHSGALHNYTPYLSKNIQETLQQTWPNYQLPIPPIPVRARPHQEATDSLKTPVYSSCAVPVVVYTSEPWSYDSMLQHVGSWLYSVVGGVADSVRQKLQLVVVTPDGLPLAEFAQEMLQPLFENPVLSLAEASQRGGETAPCFKEMLVCTQNPTINVRKYAQSLAARYTAGMQRAAPTTSKVRRVAFERPSDNGYGGLQNVAELVQQCSTAKVNGYSLWCSALTPTESVSSNAKTLQDVDVLVTAHGPRTLNAMMLPSGSSVIEVVPLDMAVEATNTETKDSELRWATLFVCSPEYSVPSDLEHTSGRPRALMPMLRNSKVPWGSIEKVLEGLIAVKDTKLNQKQVFYASKITTRPALPAEPTHRCPGDNWIDGRESNTTASRDKYWRGPYPKQHNFTAELDDGGVEAIWHVPANAKDILLLFNGAERLPNQWFPPTPQCPDCCVNCYEHHKLTKTALEMRMAVIALKYVEKHEYLYPAYIPSLGDMMIEWDAMEMYRGAYDPRPDPWESIDLPKIRRTIYAIMQQEQLQGERLFAAGFSSGARFTHTLAAAMTEIKGTLSLSMRAVHLDGYISQMAQFNRKLPPFAIIHQPMDIGMVPGIINTLETYKKLNVPTLEVTSWPLKVTKQELQAWMKVSSDSVDSIMKWMARHKLYDVKTGTANFHFWKSDAVTKLATNFGERFPEIPPCNFAEWMFHTQGFHYPDCTHCKEVLLWLRSGGVERVQLPPTARSRTHPRFKGMPVVDPLEMPDGTALAEEAPDGCV